MTFLDAISFFKLLLLLPYDSPSEQLRAANISDKGIARLPAKLAFLKSLKKLIASKNVMTDLTPLSVLVTLSHLDISSNPALIDLVPLRPLVNLSVINISNCKVSSLRGLEGCRSLSALSLIHISEPTRLLSISYAVFCLKKKKNKNSLKYR
eukprot:TRINITY_DN6970_c0_g2_i2.p1 TRINITY_DN6970_c0_g2~~TRINITY_DN6970_c0_g2_i2.p1  ORF type:complete len:152 (-),score=37.95 TRINITY_DN6970_c0_g2_i2:28-483(-)